VTAFWESFGSVELLYQDFEVLLTPSADVLLAPKSVSNL